MTENGWLIDEVVAPDESDINLMEPEPATRSVSREVATQALPVNLAVRLQDIMIWDIKKWFGDADMRLDALVVHGNTQTTSIYMPQTFRFPGIQNKDRLPTGENGLLIFYGDALHFLDIFITVSRDRNDSDDLATLLSQELQSPETQGAMGAGLGLVFTAPHAATATATIAAAAVLGNLAYKLLSKVTGNTIGLYRTSWLQHRDEFGIGRHPESGSHKVKDLSFWYEIIQEGN